MLINNNEDYFRTAQLNAYLNSLVEEDLLEEELVIDPELEGCEIEEGEFQGDYAYPCDRCGTNLIVEDPHAVFEPVEHVCPGSCYR